MSNAEVKVKSVYPDAELGYGLVTPKTKWVWSTDNNLYNRELLSVDHTHYVLGVTKP
jgi:hypothetical protein